MSFRGSCVLLILVGSFVSTFCEQVTSQSKRNQHKAPTRQVRTELDVSPREPSGKIGQAAVSYLADSNHTLVGVSLMVLSEGEPYLSDLWIGFVVSGRELTKPAVVEFRLTTHGEAKGLFKGPAAFEFKAAGKSYKLDNLKRKRDSFVGVPEQLISGNIPFAGFEQIAGSDEIVVRAGSLLFVLRESDREGIRDLLKAAAGASLDK